MKIKFLHVSINNFELPQEKLPNTGGGVNHRLNTHPTNQAPTGRHKKHQSIFADVSPLRGFIKTASLSVGLHPRLYSDTPSGFKNKSRLLTTILALPYFYPYRISIKTHFYIQPTKTLG